MTRSRTNHARRRRRGLSAANMRVHALLVVGLPVCIAAGWFELTRALAGRQIAWIYAFEWPVFGVYGVYIWWRLSRENDPAAHPSRPAGAGAGANVVSPAGPAVPPSGDEPSGPVDDDVELVAWKRYLSNLQSVDPPGGPPDKSR